MISEINQTEKDKNDMIPLMGGILKKKIKLIKQSRKWLLGAGRVGKNREKKKTLFFTVSFQ